MGKTTLSTIKNWFKRGYFPTEEQFQSTWDSFRHKDDRVTVEEVENLTDYLTGKAEKQEVQIINNDLQNLKSANKTTIDLGDIGSELIEVEFNDEALETPIAVNSTGYVEVMAIQQNRRKIWLFTGASGVYDGNEVLAIAEDFSLIFDDGIVNYQAIQDALGDSPVLAGGNVTDTAKTLRDDVDYVSIAETTTFDFGDIINADIWDEFNDEALSSTIEKKPTGKFFIKAIQQEIPITWEFIGGSGIYDGVNVLAIEQDFQIVTDPIFRKVEGDRKGYVVLPSDFDWVNSNLGFLSNSKIEIKDIFDLGGRTCIMPSGVIIRYNGGQLNNGLLDCRFGVIIEGEPSGSARIIEHNSNQQTVVDDLNKVSRTTGNITIRSNGEFKLTKDTDLDGYTNSTFQYREGAKNMFLDLNSHVLRSIKTGEQMGLLLLPTIGETPENSHINFSGKNGTIENFKITTGNSITNLSEIGINYDFENVHFKDCVFLLSTKRISYQQNLFKYCTFENCMVQIDALNESEDYVSDYQDWKDHIFDHCNNIFFMCEIITGAKNMNNNEPIHFGDPMPFSKSKLLYCNFKGREGGISSDYIDCYDSSNIIIEGCTFEGELGSKVNGQNGEPFFINIKATPPSYDETNTLLNPITNQKPYAVRRNVLIKGNTFIVKQPTVEATESYIHPAIIQCTLRSGLSDSDTLEFTEPRRFVEFSNNFIYLNNISMNELSIVHSDGANSWNILENNKIFINKKLISRPLRMTQPFDFTGIMLVFL